jgi:hypothetical protein
MLRPGSWGDWQWSVHGRVIASIGVRAKVDRVILTYRHGRDGDGKDEEYPVLITRTVCNLGGTRAWFICPTAGCLRRVALLYGGTIFACRHCYQLVYASSREDAGDRARRRADRIRARLGWKSGILNGAGLKPKWMRWRTFQRLTEAHEQHVNRSLRAAGIKFGLGRPTR